jgi:hypothetical protein
MRLTIIKVPHHGIEGLSGRRRAQVRKSRSVLKVVLFATGYISLLAALFSVEASTGAARHAAIVLTGSAHRTASLIGSAVQHIFH